MALEERIDADRVRALFQKWLMRSHQRPATDLCQGRSGVVLAGAGKVGQEFLGALRASGIEVLAFTDNAAAKWHTTIADVPVLQPSEAAARFGRDAVFLISIGGIGPGIADIRRQFAELGAATMLHFPEAIGLLPAIWPRFFADPTSIRATDEEPCLAAFRLLADEESRRHFVTHLRWRMTLDPSALAPPDYDHQYFPAGVISPRHCASFVDVGAYTGDTLLALDAFADGAWREYYGFEPDPVNYAALSAHAAAVAGSRPSVKVETRRSAVGASEGTIAFAGNGEATSQVDPAGRVRVPCTTLDSADVGSLTYLKVDVEGGEQDVLSGGTATLSASRPTVAIASYHHPRDLFDLPLALAAIASDYRFYLRSHGDAGIDLVCYAVRERVAPR